MERELTLTQLHGLDSELERDQNIAERAARDASRELQNIETSVSFAKKKVKDLHAAAECASPILLASTGSCTLTFG